MFIKKSIKEKKTYRQHQQENHRQRQQVIKTIHA